jgi:protein O-mannosyl-transferase
MVPTRPGLRHGLPVLIAVLAVLPFLPAVTGEFLNWDDDANFLFNQNYRGLGPSNLRWMFTDIFGHYMPITWLTLGLDHVLWGMNPTGYHVTSMLLHAVSAALCFLFLQKLLGREGPAAAGALFFAVHPLRCESVAWITERRDVAAGVFFFLTLLAYLRWTETKGRRWLWMSVAAFAGMLLCKAMAMTLPVALLVLDAFPLRRFSSERPAKLLLEKVPFFALMVGAVAATWVPQSHAQALYTREAYPYVQSVAQPGYRISFYVLKTFAPVRLSPLYWYRPDLGLPQVLGWLAVIGVTALAVVGRRVVPALGAAWLAFLILIAPVAGIFQAGPHFAADRYTYFAGVPFAALVAAAFASLPQARRSIGIAAAAVLLAGLGVLTTLQSRIWKDSVSLWTRAIELDPDVYFTLQRRGKAFAARGDWDRALADYNRSIELNRFWHESWESRARARLARNDLQGAFQDAGDAIRLKRDSGEAWFLFGLAGGRMGHPSAIDSYSRALELRPNFVEARVERALERRKRGDLAGALADLDAAIAFDSQPRILSQRGITRAMNQDLRGAIADFEQALQRAPADWPHRAQVEKHLLQARSELPR